MSRLAWCWGLRKRLRRPSSFSRPTMHRSSPAKSFRWTAENRLSEHSPLPHRRRADQGRRWAENREPKGETAAAVANVCGMAEREGFEPPIRLPVRRISSAVLSTTQPPLRGLRQAQSPLASDYLTKAPRANKAARFIVAQVSRKRWRRSWNMRACCAGSQQPFLDSVRSQPHKLANGGAFGPLRAFRRAKP
jgi:hypothetical protein